MILTSDTYGLSSPFTPQWTPTPSPSRDRCSTRREEEEEEQAPEINESKRRRVNVRPDTGATEESDAGAMEPTGGGHQDDSQSILFKDEGATESEGGLSCTKQAEGEFLYVIVCTDEDSEELASQGGGSGSIEDPGCSQRILKFDVL